MNNKSSWDGNNATVAVWWLVDLEDDPRVRDYVNGRDFEFDKAFLAWRKVVYVRGFRSIERMKAVKHYYESLYKPNGSVYINEEMQIIRDIVREKEQVEVRKTLQEQAEERQRQHQIEMAKRVTEQKVIHVNPISKPIKRPQIDISKI